MSGPVAARLDDSRVHFQHGPIDLIISVDGPEGAVASAHKRAWSRFQTILAELSGELAILRQPLGSRMPETAGKVARSMVAACWPYRDRFVTPMAAVAGAVADEILAAMQPGPPLRRIMINNGGDIALYLGDGEEAAIGLAAPLERPTLAGAITVRSRDPSRGIATSGWRGRSQSLGVADAATILAKTAAQADAAATMIANAINADHPAITRLPASAVKDDSDLADLMVTVEVGTLPQEIVAQALDHGEAEAMGLQHRNLIDRAVLLLQGQIRVIGTAEHRSERVLQSCH